MRTPVRFLTLLLIPMLIGLGCSTEEELAPAPVNEQTVATAESDSSVFVVFGHEVRDYERSEEHTS